MGRLTVMDLSRKESVEELAVADRDLEAALVERFISCTLYGILLEPARCTMWFHPGCPCRNRYRPYWLGDVLEMPHAREARGELEYEPDAVFWHGIGGSLGRIFTWPRSDSRLSLAARAALIGGVARGERIISRRRGG